MIRGPPRSTRTDTLLPYTTLVRSELADIIAYSRRFRIPLIAMTSRRDSPLAEAADIALVLPDVAEACPMGLAPTTSTTMMLALGDALAIALLERKGLTSDDFHLDRKSHVCGKSGSGSGARGGRRLIKKKKQ